MEHERDAQNEFLQEIGLASAESSALSTRALAILEARCGRAEEARCAKKVQLNLNNILNNSIINVFRRKGRKSTSNLLGSTGSLQRGDTACSSLVKVYNSIEATGPEPRKPNKKTETATAPQLKELLSPPSAEKCLRDSDIGVNVSTTCLQ